MAILFNICSEKFNIFLIYYFLPTSMRTRHFCNCRDVNLKQCFSFIYYYNFKGLREAFKCNTFVQFVERYDESYDKLLIFSDSMYKNNKKRSFTMNQL